jgi:cytochrome P450
MDPLDKLFSPDWVRNPFPIYEDLRLSSPVEHGGAWLVTRNEDVMAALADPDTFSSSAHNVANPVLRETPIIFEDRPEHTAHRLLVSHAFTPRRVAALEGWIRQQSTDLLAAAGAGEVDAVAAFCEPLPVLVIARMLGLPAEVRHELKEWSDQRTYLAGLTEVAFAADPPPERLVQAVKDNDKLITYLARSIEQLPPGDNGFLSALVRAATGAEALPPRKVADLCALLLTAGNVTTTNLLANLLNTLAQDPVLFGQLRENHSRIPGAVEESLRLDSPVQWMGRTATRDAELGGTQIKAGARVLLFYGAVNRDPERFPDPDHFNHARSGQHLAFGHGIHFCLGAPLARLEARIALDVILDECSALHPGAVPGTRIDSAATHRGFSRLPLRFIRENATPPVTENSGEG